MAEEKKISFGFSKLKAPSKVISASGKPNSSKTDDNSKQFIDCLENQSIKVKAGTVDEKKELIIPLKQSNVRTINIKKEPELLKIIKEETEGDSNGVIAADTNSNNNQEVIPSDNPTVQVKFEVDEKDSLDAQARREILADLGKTGESENETQVFSLPLTTNAPKEGEKESTLDDYENIPIQEFGLAMLRGMGWKPDPNKNKNKPSDVILRPKGLGLGADRSAVTQTVKANSNTADTKLIKNCYIKITGGINKNCYGKLESFNEDSGRVVVKLAIRDEHVTVSETLLIRVSKDEYDKNSRVINMNKYEEYKEKEPTQETKSDNHHKQDEQTRRNNEREHTKYRDDSDRKYKTSYESKSHDRYKEKSRIKKEHSKGNRNTRDGCSSESEEESSRHKSYKESGTYQSRSHSSRDNLMKTTQKENRNHSDSENDYYDQKRKEHKFRIQKEVTSKKFSSKSRDSSSSGSSSEEKVSYKSSKHSKYVEKSNMKNYVEKKKKHSVKEKKKSKKKRQHSSSESEESRNSDSSEEERKKKRKKSKHRQASSDSEDYRRKKKHSKKK